jgi:hypothetical protein
VVSWRWKISQELSKHTGDSVSDYGIRKGSIEEMEEVRGKLLG